MMHLYERVTNADRRMEEFVRKLLVEQPEVSHFVAPSRPSRLDRIRSAA